jgi:FkbM family methyltransferase
MSLLIKIKSLIQEILGVKYHLRIKIKVKKKWLGSDYGGFYICPVGLNEKSIVYSFGIGEDISFDKSIIDEFHCKVYAFDPTPKSIKWVSNNAIINNFHFFPYGIDDKSGMVEFMLPINDDYISGSTIKQSNVDINKIITVEMRNIFDISSVFKHAKIDILKMDIEGSEYKVIENILKTDIEINQILIEIHERYFEDGKNKTANMIFLLKKFGYKLFAISNGREELSFIKVN